MFFSEIFVRQATDSLCTEVELLRWPVLVSCFSVPASVHVAGTQVPADTQREY